MIVPVATGVPPPTKIIAVHVNYRSRALQRGSDPAWPSYFLKPPSVARGQRRSGRPAAGMRAARLRGRGGARHRQPGRRVTPAAAWTHVAWVTAANDFGVYDLRYADRGSNVRSKGIDGLTPLGPRLLDAPRVDPATLRLRTWVNGELAQDAKLGEELLFGFGDIVADLSRLMTLEPGDVILTGTPAGSTVVEPGDLVEVEVTAGTTTGRLRSPIGPSPDPPTVGGRPRRLPDGATPRADRRRAPAGARPGRRPSRPPARVAAGLRRCPPPRSPRSCASGG